MKAVLAAILVALLAAPLAAMPVAAEERRPAERVERYLPIVEVGESPRAEGLWHVRVRMGDVILSVRWSENESIPMGLEMALGYRRFFGAAELYDEQGNYLRTTGLPLHTALFQTFDHMIEFRDLDGDTLFDPHEFLNRTDFAGDPPVKAISLRNAWHLDGTVARVVADASAWVNFTLSAYTVPYARVYDAGNRTWRNGTAGDGTLDRISLTFRLAASAHAVRATIPFYRVYLANGNIYEPTRSEFLENRTVSGVSLSVDGKYDQRIDGWDFAYLDSKIALATGIGFGNKIDLPIVQWLQRQFGGACLKDGTFEHCESDEGPTTPVRIARDHLRIAEGWHRAGEMYWVSDVSVDGLPSTMTFEIYRIAPIAQERLEGGDLVNGFRAFGAFVYPQGQSIVHDPGLRASTMYANLAEPTNLAPSVLVALQLGVAAVALIPAVLLRRRARRGKA